MTTQIGIGLFVSLIYAVIFGFFAPFLFQWIAGFFDPAPNAPRDCGFSDFLEKTLSEYQACKDQSNSFPIRMERLSRKIPWFWIAFVLFGWTFLRNPLKGRIRDDSEDVTYDGQGGMDFLAMIIGQFMFYICLWAFFIRSKNSFIALGVGIVAILIWYLTHKWLLKNYGQTKLERQSP